MFCKTVSNLGEENGEEYVAARADALNLTRHLESIDWADYRDHDNGMSSDSSSDGSEDEA